MALDTFTHPEPAPERNTTPAVWDLVLADIKSRDASGERKYGTRLQPFNGRDPLIDAYQEALDLVVYLRQALYERHNRQGESMKDAVDYFMAVKETNTVLSEVQEERRRQDKKWGQQNHQPPLWLSILGEEYGEVCKAVCEAHFTGYESTGDWSQYRKELIQTAAVAVAMVECLDRGKP